MPRIFISYRREDSVAYAGRIYDRLVAQFGETNVFMDIDTLEPGVDFVEELQRTVQSCDVFLAVIGIHWLAVKDEEGRVRLANPEDFVALELGAALERASIRVVPMLVGGARMPRSPELPQRLSGLTRRHALVLPDIGFQQALGRLIQSIDQAEKARLEEERRQAAEKARLEEECGQAAEKARLEEERRQAAEKARLEEERGQTAEKARLEEERRQAAEKARLEEERWQAAEKARLEEERWQAAEKARLEEERWQAAEKARLEQERWQAAENARLDFPGLGNIAAKVIRVIGKGQAMIDKALDAAIAWIIAEAKATFARLFANKD